MDALGFRFALFTVYSMFHFALIYFPPMVVSLTSHFVTGLVGRGFGTIVRTSFGFSTIFSVLGRVFSVQFYVFFYLVMCVWYQRCSDMDV